MATNVIVVKARHDPDAKVWFVEHCDLPGLNLEADTLEALADKLPAAIADLIEEGNLDDGGEGYDIPVELIAHASTRVRSAAA